MIENEYDVVIVDTNIDELSKEEFVAVLEKEKPDVVGISVLTNEYSRAGYITAELIKSVNKSIIVVIGGVYATSSYSSAIEDKNIDYVVMGEGEYVFKKLLRYLNGRGELPAKGITYKNNGEIIITPRENFITDLDALPLPSYHKVNYLKYANLNPGARIDGPKEYPYARILTSRGCGVGCCFCEVGYLAGKHIRSRSPDNVIAEIEWLKSEYGIRSVLFDDDNMFLDKERVKDLFKDIIKRKLNINWNSIETAVFLLDEEMLELMSESGCRYLCVAIESGVERVLKDIIHKPIKLDYAIKMVKKARELGMVTASNFVIGFPGETWDEIRQTIKFAEEYEVDYVKIFVATPLPETELYRIAKNGGYLHEEYTFEDVNWFYGPIETDEFTPNELAVLRAYEWDRINFTDPERRNKLARIMNITEEELNNIRKRTLRSIRL